MKTKVALFLALFIASRIFPCHAQTLTGTAPSTVVVGESFRVVYSVAADKAEGFSLGALPDGLELVMEPYSATSVEGGRSVTRFTAVLCAEKPGEYTLRPAKAKANGKELVAKPVNFVAAKSYRPSQSQPNQPTKRKSTDKTGMTDSGNSPLEIRVMASRRRVLQNQPVIITYSVQSSGTIEHLTAGMPEIPDCYIAELPNADPAKGDAFVWARYAVFPQRSGTLRIPAVKFTGLVKTRVSSKDAFDAYLDGSTVRSQSVVASSQPLTITVDTLPPTPSGFSGAVGCFSFYRRSADTQAIVGEPVKIRLAAKGDGNVRLLKAPAIQWPKGFTPHETKLRDTLVCNLNSVTGEAVFEYSATPNTTGLFDNIPPVEFVYYDTDSLRYVTRRVEMMAITVGAGGSQNRPGRSGGNAEEGERTLRPQKGLGNSDWNIDIERANDAFLLGDYQKAISLYLKELRKKPSAEIHYNLANAYLSMDSLGKAVEHYKLAEQLDGIDSDIQHNLALALDKVKDKRQKDGEWFLTAWLRWLYRLFCYWFSTSCTPPFGVIMDDGTLVKTMPEAAAPTAFIVNEGEPYEIKDDNLSEWREVEFEDGSTGWIRNEK